MGRKGWQGNGRKRSNSVEVTAPDMFVSDESIARLSPRKLHGLHFIEVAFLPACACQPHKSLSQFRALPRDLKNVSAPVQGACLTVLLFACNSIVAIL